MADPQDDMHRLMGEQQEWRRLTNTLEAIKAGQHRRERMDAAFQAQLATLIAGTRRLSLAVVGVGVLTVILSAGVAWLAWHQPDVDAAQALTLIDAAIGREWAGLPKPVQEDLGRVYRGVGLVPPSQRK